MSLEENTNSDSLVKKYKLLTSAEIHKQQVRFAQTMKNDISLTVSEAINSIDSLDTNIEADKKVMFSELNVFLRDIDEVLFNLRFLALNYNEKSNSKVALLDVINQLVVISDGVKNGFHLNFNNQETNFKNSVKEVDIVSEQLLKAIKEDELHQFKQELVDMLNDLLSTVDRVKIRNQIRNSNQSELKLYFSKAGIDVVKLLDSLKSEKEVVLTYLLHHFLRGCQHMLKVFQHLQKYGKQYEIDVFKSLDHTANALNEILGDIQGIARTCDSVATILPKFAKHMTEGYATLGDVLEFLNDQDYTNLKETVVYVTVETIVNGSQLYRGLVDTASQV